MIVTGRHVPARRGARSSASSTRSSTRTTCAARPSASRKRIAAKRPLPRVRDKTDQLAEAKADPGMFDAMRKSIARKARNQKAPYHCIAAWRPATTQPFDEGIADRARAVRRAGELRRSARRCATPSSPSARWRSIPGAPQGPRSRREIRSAAVIGAGTMGGGIAMCFADFGIPVKMLEARAGGARQAACSACRDNYAVSVKRGSLTQAQMDERLPLHPAGASATRRSPTPTSSSRRCSSAWTSRRRCSRSSTR